MQELGVEQVKALLKATEWKVPEADLERLTVRLNGMLALQERVNSLPLGEADIIPTLLTQRRE